MEGIKIVYVITGLGMGGAETQVCNLADEFSKLGNTVTIIYLTGNRVVTPNDPNINLVPLNMNKSVVSPIKAFIQFVKLINSIKPDVVHSHMVHANLFTRIARIFSTIPLLISTAHSSNEGGKLRMLVYRLTDKLADITTNVGQESVNAFIVAKAAPKGRIISMPNGINTERFKSGLEAKLSMRATLKVEPQQKLVLAVGRNDPAKDYPNMLEAISKLPFDLNFKLFIVGLGVEQLQPKVDKLDISDRVILLGLRKDVDQLMAAADILLMSSEWEGLPIVIGEAMASECNIVTTDAGGCKEWLTNAEKPVPIKNPQALSNALAVKLALSNNELSAIGKNNREHIIKHFSLDGIVAKWQSIYQGG
ncbi:glycosyltransferase [uncultured Pseudoalteromonas sp.]|uniref:glycosyltransferase n=1 Tax=uncultured Pseudoalteromonas sp. TaxID=114053 RepID=UPI0025935BB0|nr:glycosyltransferase [uncultured Pseudoalteromonas sp.]